MAKPWLNPTVQQTISAQASVVSEVLDGRQCLRQEARWRVKESNSHLGVRSRKTLSAKFWWSGWYVVNGDPMRQIRRRYTITKPRRINFPDRWRFGGAFGNIHKTLSARNVRPYSTSWQRMVEFPRIIEIFESSESQVLWYEVGCWEVWNPAGRSDVSPRARLSFNRACLKNQCVRYRY